MAVAPIATTTRSTKRGAYLGKLDKLGELAASRVVGAPVVPESIAVPHSTQKRAPDTRCAPHWVQKRALTKASLTWSVEYQGSLRRLCALWKGYG